jgi:hypothetical protein
MQRPPKHHDYAPPRGAQVTKEGELQRPHLSLASTPPETVRGPSLIAVDEVVDMLGGRKSAWWVRNHFAPIAKLKIGRSLFWERAEAERWIREQRATR